MNEDRLNKIQNVYGIKEFQPIVEMCREWLSQRDESKHQKTNEELLKDHMDTEWLPMGWVETYTCKFVTKFDLMEDTDKSKVWKSCVNEYLKSEYAVYEKTPAHGRDVNGIILAPFNSKEEAEEMGKKYGYYGENYYVDVLRK